MRRLAWAARRRTAPLRRLLGSLAGPLVAASRKAGPALRVVGLAVLVVLAWYRPVLLLLVKGASMVPAMAPGDVAVVVRQRPVAPGAIACFADGAGLVCHRVIGIGPSGWLTKGDANASADAGEMSRGALVGPVVAVLPTGRAAAWLVRVSERARAP